MVTLPPSGVTTKGKAVADGLVPPIAGWEWHIPHEFPLNVGPNPLTTASGLTKRAAALLKKVVSSVPVPVLKPATGQPVPTMVTPLTTQGVPVVPTRGPGSTAGLGPAESWNAKNVNTNRNNTLKLNGFILPHISFLKSI